jgi:hypothetical protein
MSKVFLGAALEVVRENPRRIDAAIRSALLFLRAQTSIILAPQDGSGSFDLLLLHRALEYLKRVSVLTVQHHQSSRRRGMQMECSGNLSAYAMLSLAIYNHSISGLPHEPMLMLVLVPLLLMPLPWMSLDLLFLNGNENKNCSTVIVIDSVSVSEFPLSSLLIVVLWISLKAMPMPMPILCGCGVVVVSVSYIRTVLFSLY